MLKYVGIENARCRRSSPMSIKSTNIFIPISYVLEYREFWEDVDNDKIDLSTDYNEYDGVVMSSLKYVKGERNYYQTIRKNKEALCIDLVQEYNDREEDPMSINLTYTEKYLLGSGNRGVLRNRNEFLINKSRPELFDWDSLQKDNLLKDHDPN